MRGRESVWESVSLSETCERECLPETEWKRECGRECESGPERLCPTESV